MAGFLQKAFPKEVLKKTCFVDNTWNSAENLKPVAVFVSKGKQNRVNRIFLFSFVSSLQQYLFRAYDFFSVERSSLLLSLLFILLELALVFG